MANSSLSTNTLSTDALSTDALSTDALSTDALSTDALSTEHFSRLVPGLSIMDVCSMSVGRADEFFAQLSGQLTEFQHKIADEVIQ